MQGRLVGSVRGAATLDLGVVSSAPTLGVEMSKNKIFKKNKKGKYSIGISQ